MLFPYWHVWLSTILTCTGTTRLSILHRVQHKLVPWQKGIFSSWPHLEALKPHRATQICDSNFVCANPSSLYKGLGLWSAAVVDPIPSQDWSVSCSNLKHLFTPETSSFHLQPALAYLGQHKLILSGGRTDIALRTSPAELAQMCFITYCNSQEQVKDVCAGTVMDLDLDCSVQHFWKFMLV